MADLVLEHVLTMLLFTSLIVQNTSQPSPRYTLEMKYAIAQTIKKSKEADQEGPWQKSRIKAQLPPAACVKHRSGDGHTCGVRTATNGCIVSESCGLNAVVSSPSKLPSKRLQAKRLGVGDTTV